MDFKIRPVMKKDLKNVVKIFHIPEFKLAYGEYLDNKIYSKYLDSKYFLLAQKENKIIGAIMGERLRADGAVIWYIAVKKEYRKLGIGSKLLDKFEKNHFNSKGKWIMLYAVPKTRLSKFYKKHSYSKGQDYIEFAKKVK